MEEFEMLKLFAIAAICFGIAVTLFIPEAAVSGPRNPPQYPTCPPGC
jgi:hypothetical protein